MPEVFQGLKKEFPSLSDDDAQKASAMIYQGQAPIEPVLEPDPVDVSAPAVQPQAAVVPGNSQPMSQEQQLAELQDPSTRSQSVYRYILQKQAGNLAQAQKDLEDRNKTNFNDWASTILSFAPDNRFAAIPAGINQRKRDSAMTAYQASLNAAKYLMGQENWEKEYGIKSADLGLKFAGEGREQEKWLLEQEKLKAESERRKRLEDPNSPETQMYRAVAKQYFPKLSRALDQMTAAQIDDKMPMLKGAFDSVNSRLEAQSRIGETSRQNDISNEMRQMQFNMQQDEKQTKKDAARREIDERANNMLRAVNAMQDMIAGPVGPDGQRSGGKGTAELFGSHNEILNGYINDLATEYSKMLDPSTGVRDPEVVRFMSTTFQPGNPFQRDKTAVELLENFKKKIEDRKVEAYRRYNTVATPSDNDANSGNKTSAEIIKREVSPSTGKIRLTYSDGTKRVIDAQSK